MTPTPDERHALAARLEREWMEADPRAHREACLTQALLEAYKEIEELRERVRDLEIEQ
jgi:hypothetical protein